MEDFINWHGHWQLDGLYLHVVEVMEVKKIVNFVLPQMNLNKNIYKIIQLQGWVNDFLSWKAFVPFSRVSYIIYLVHQDLMRFLLGFHEAAIPGSVMMFVSDNFWF